MLQNGAQFGFSLSQYGNLLAVGSRLDDSKGISDSGITYLYQIETNGTATYLNKIYAPDMGGGDQFGISVSQSGNILAVGSYAADPGAFRCRGDIYGLSDYIPNQVPTT